MSLQAHSSRFRSGSEEPEVISMMNTTQASKHGACWHTCPLAFPSTVSSSNEHLNLQVVLELRHQTSQEPHVAAQHVALAEQG